MQDGILHACQLVDSETRTKILYGGLFSQVIYDLVRWRGLMLAPIKPTCFTAALHRRRSFSFAARMHRLRSISTLEILVDVFSDRSNRSAA